MAGVAGEDDDATVAADRHGDGTGSGGAHLEARCHADSDSENKKRGWWRSGDGDATREAPPPPHEIPVASSARRGRAREREIEWLAAAAGSLSRGTVAHAATAHRGTCAQQGTGGTRISPRVQPVQDKKTHVAVASRFVFPSVPSKLGDGEGGAWPWIQNIQREEDIWRLEADLEEVLRVPKKKQKKNRVSVAHVSHIYAAIYEERA